MKLETKKKSTRVCVGLFFLLGGIEYAVILPTLWLYLEHRFDAEQWFFGVVFAAFCFSSLLASPLFGFWVDYTQKTKSAILFANLFEIGGNFLYFVAWSKYWVLGARLVAGTGAGIASGIFAQIARTTTEKERTGMYSVAMALRQFGLLVGPGFNLFLRKFNIKLGSFKVDAYTAPGIFMAVVWLLQEVIMLFFYYDLPNVHTSNAENVFDNSINSNENSFESKPLSSEVNGGLTDASTTDDPGKLKLTKYVTGGGSRKRSRTSSVVENWHLASDLVREEVILILASQFLMFFNETALEAIITPMSEYLLGWKEIENSIAFCLIAFEAISVFVLVRQLSRKISDRWLMVIGIAFEGFALVWYLALLANAKPHSSIVLPTVIVGTLVIVFGLPFFSVANVSLYSKITDERTQGIAQGIQRSVTGLAMILGPLWGGALTRRLYLMLGVMAALEFILAYSKDAAQQGRTESIYKAPLAAAIRSMYDPGAQPTASSNKPYAEVVMMFLSFDRLKEPTKQAPTSYNEINADNERRPLLA